MKEKNFFEKKISSKKVFDGEFLNIFSDKVLLPNGEQANREYFKHPGASAIIGIDPNGLFLMEKQYRYPVQELCIEFPAGKTDKNESPIETAQRELKEETGFVSENWHLLGNFHPTIGYSDEIIYLFLALDIKKKYEPSFDHGEYVETFFLSEDDLLNHVRTGKIRDSKTIVCFFKYLLQKKLEK